MDQPGRRKTSERRVRTLNRSDTGVAACLGIVLSPAPEPSSHERTALSDIAAGDIVECIDDTPSRPESQVMPDLGALYLVTSIRPVDVGHSVRLKELIPSCHLGGVCACGQCGWDAGRFRKVHRPRPDFFAALLQPIPELV
jgi:hypothetical protein